MYRVVSVHVADLAGNVGICNYGQVPSAAENLVVTTSLQLAALAAIWHR